MDHPPFEEQVAELARQLGLLRSSVRDMQEEYAREVRTERITIVDEDGIHRIVLSARQRTGSVLVRLDGPGGQTSGAELYASDDPEGGVPEIGVCLIKDGNIVTTWRCV